jgi:lipoprotein-releasing system permease protein
MAMVGLMLSSFSLLVVQSALKGLQNNRINRAKSVSGHYTLYIEKKSSDTQALMSWLTSSGVSFVPELEIEGLLRKDGHIVPAIIHGVSHKHYIPEFLPENIERTEILVSSFMAHKLHSYLEDEVQFISPSHTDSFFGDLPRYKTVEMKRFVTTNEPDIDEFHAWVDLRVTQSIVRKREFNRVRIYGPLSESQIGEIQKTGVKLKSWEKLNSSLRSFHGE